MAKATLIFDDLRPPGRLNFLARWRRRRPRPAAPMDPFLPAASAPRAGAPGACSELWPVIAQAARGPAPAAVCDLAGDPPARPLRVAASEAELRALIAHLGAITAHVLGAHVRPRAAVRADGVHAVLHWAGPEDAESGLQLARLFTRLSHCAVAPAAAERALYASVREVQRIAHASGGRAYAAPSPLAVMGLTVRLPLRSGADAFAVGSARP